MILPVRIEYARMGIIDCSRGSTTSWYSMTIGTLRKSMSLEGQEHVGNTGCPPLEDDNIRIPHMACSALIHDTGLYQSSTSTTSNIQARKMQWTDGIPTRFHPGKIFLGSIWRNRTALTSADSEIASDNLMV